MQSIFFFLPFFLLLQTNVYNMKQYATTPHMITNAKNKPLFTYCAAASWSSHMNWYEWCSPRWSVQFSQGKDAKSINVIAENDIISNDGIKENLAYTLVTQREPDNQVYH